MNRDKKDLLIILFLYVSDVILETKLVKKWMGKLDKHHKEYKPEIKGVEGLKDE